MLSLLDPFDLRRVPEHVTTIAWIRNWTERWLERPWFDRVDVLLASSQALGRVIESATGRPTIRFPARHQPRALPPRPAQARYQADYVFTGNHWGVDRDIQRALAPTPARARRGLRQGLGEAAGARAVRARRSCPTRSCLRCIRASSWCSTTPRGRRCPTAPSTRGCSTRWPPARWWSPTASPACASCSTRTSRSGTPRRRCARAWTSCWPTSRAARSSTRRYREQVLRKHTYAHRASQLREILRRARVQADVRVQDRRARPRAGRALGRSALRRGARRASCDARGHRTTRADARRVGAGGRAATTTSRCT